MAQAQINLERLAKVWALVESGNEGEIDAARSRATAMVEPFGYVIEDIPDLLAEGGFGDGAPTAGPGGFTFYNMNNPAHVKAWGRENAAKRRRWMRENADRIAEVIARYGSEEAVFARTPEELALDAAVEPFRDPRVEGSFPTFDGQSFRPTEKVAEAMGRVVPWPETIPDALAEYQAWERLVDDRNITGGNEQAEYLSAGADLRRTHLGDMVEKLIPARNLSDVIVRLRFQVESEGIYDDAKAVLADLERLESEGNADTPDHNEAAPPFKLNTASQRRAEVERILATPEGKAMTLRKVASRAGVSPATVMNIRRRMAS
ncbi:MAG: Lrp/AsnC family transcriptional regulator [Acetobacter aceti]|uniref:Lrp/AsnC family transcriptional regulator n=1 Tax=Gluconobacter sp. TaxID=1876758 RepID=UPI0039E95F29